MKTEIQLSLPDHWADDAVRLLMIAVQIWIYITSKQAHKRGASK